MRTDFLMTRLAVVAALFLVLATMTACNDHDDAGDGEAVVEVTATTLAGNVGGAGTAVDATLSLKLQDRSGLAGSFFNDVLFTSYTVTSSTATGFNGAITSNACPIGGTCDLKLVVVLAGDSLAAGAGHLVTVQVSGMDLNGNPVTFTHQIAVPYT